jgi:hypothetical protein
MCDTRRVAVGVLDAIGVIGIKPANHAALEVRTIARHARTSVTSCHFEVLSSVTSCHFVSRADRA